MSEARCMIATSTVLGISKLPGRNVAPGSGNPRPSERGSVNRLPSPSDRLKQAISAYEWSDCQHIDEIVVKKWRTTAYCDGALHR